jgi:hypothetical protein
VSDAQLDPGVGEVLVSEEKLHERVVELGR